MELLLDTNFIVTSLKQKIPVFEILKKDFPEYKIIIPIEVIYELEKIKENNSSTIMERESAELSLFLIKKGNYQNISLGSKNVDSGIINYLIKHPKTIVATMDRELREKLKKKVSGVKFMLIRQKSRFVIE